MGADCPKSHQVPAPQCSSLSTFSSRPCDPHGRLLAQHVPLCPCHTLLIIEPQAGWAA